MVGDELNDWIYEHYPSQSWIVSQMKTTLSSLKQQQSLLKQTAKLNFCHTCHQPLAARVNITFPLF